MAEVVLEFSLRADSRANLLREFVAGEEQATRYRSHEGETYQVNVVADPRGGFTVEAEGPIGRTTYAEECHMFDSMGRPIRGATAKLVSGIQNESGERIGTAKVGSAPDKALIDRLLASPEADITKLETAASTGSQ